MWDLSTHHAIHAYVRCLTYSILRLQAEASGLAARFSGNWEHGLDRDEQGTVFLDVDPYCFQQILQYLRLRMNHPAKEVPLPAIPHDKHFAYASLVKFFCLEEYMGYWSDDKLDFSDTQQGITVLG